ncbi:MAG: signal recognition particle-docking protein FtsY [Chloroflexi bacterium]|nr:signal recognition particle-docking protein FtsY [Chloroflexota bacterium]MCL5074267.1 signal recognition particle-docking protein FtsY [Chloroflexota bacterium]
MWNKLRKTDKIEDGVRRTRDSFFGRLSGLFNRAQIDESLWDEIEELLIQADVGVPATTALIERGRQRVKQERISDPLQVKEILRQEMVAIFGHRQLLSLQPDRLNAILVVGVNGTGKTTSIAKLAYYLQNSGYKVIIAAADTFRAAAAEQIQIWGERLGVAVIAHQPGSDPGAVVYDAWQAAVARKLNVLIIDTAGRLHTKLNLMEELKKISRVLKRQDESAPHEVLLVLDATTGQNALAQARHFTAAASVTGIVLAKLDGTAKGGVSFAIAQELGLPIKFIGVGEKLSDLSEFEAETFVGALIP